MSTITKPSLTDAVHTWLFALILLDATIAIIALFFPEVWFECFHGVVYIDPEGLLRRCGANWAAFALFQAIAYFKWPKKPYWLAIVAGMRLSDVFADWTYLYFAQNVTHFAQTALFLAGPFNFFAASFFLKAYTAQAKLKPEG